MIFARYDNTLASLIADDRVFSVLGLQRKTKADNTTQDDLEYAMEKLNILSSVVDLHTLIIIDNLFDAWIEMLSDRFPKRRRGPVQNAILHGPSSSYKLVFAVGRVLNSSRDASLSLPSYHSSMRNHKSAKACGSFNYMMEQDRGHGRGIPQAGASRRRHHASCVPSSLPKRVCIVCLINHFAGFFAADKVYWTKSRKLYGKILAVLGRIQC